MILLTAEKLNKSYPQRVLLRGASLGINEGDKIGVIGVNGTGKSTLLKILAGVEEPDSGLVTTGRGVRVAWLPQSPAFEEGRTVLEEAMAQVAQGHEAPREYECRSILDRLGLKDLSASVGTLSGGQKKRLAMGIALVRPSDLLILDEPTNHIDSETVDWLENYLRRYTGALVMVTHDRYFLDRVTNRIAELDHGELYLYDGANFTKYLEMKDQRLEMAAASERKRQALLKRELAWIRQGPKARGTKSRFRLERYAQESAKEVRLEEPELEMNSVSSRLGKKIMELEHLSKAFGDKTVLRDFSYRVQRGDRIGIVGHNGCGKSTFFKMLTGSVQPDSGTIEIGETVRIGYFSQEYEAMPEDKRVFDYIREISNAIETPEGTLTASQMLEKFLFDDSLQYTFIGRLSGGERRRLYLLRTLMTAPNVLLLDEPTNDLDIQILSILEDYLDRFPGVVIAASHDRYFLDKIADQIFSWEEDGQVSRTLGGYTQWLEERQNRQQERPAAKAEKEKAPERSRSRKLKFSYKEEREYQAIDGEIAGLEEQISAVEEEMAQSAADFVRLEELMAQKAHLEEQLSEKMDRWVYLNDLAERIAAGETVEEN